MSKYVIFTCNHLFSFAPNQSKSIACSRAVVFAGTYFSTFTGYIHRLRGYHGLGEDTYYHHQDYVSHAFLLYCIICMVFFHLNLVALHTMMDTMRLIPYSL